ncbi:MAG: hypothetical protein ACO2ZZ_13880 [Cyclobacteriaceae bacterium]
MSLKDLKKARAAITQKLIDSTEKGDSFTDDRIWTVTKGKDGIGSAKIRFLSVPKVDFEKDSENATAYVKLWNHGFKVKKTGKWYIENCPTTPINGVGKGNNCPVCEANRELWNSGSEAKRSIASDRKRKLSYYSNILVLKDPGNPENEGKVFIFRYGQKIFDRLQSKLKPDYEDVASIDVFDFWEGANFNIRVKNIKDSKNNRTYPNYDDSDFDDASPLFGGDDKKIEEVWSKCHSLLDLVAADKFKDYDALKAQLRGTLGAEAADFELFGGGEGVVAGLRSDDEDEVSNIKTAEDVKMESVDVDEDEADEDDAMNYFESIA